MEKLNKKVLIGAALVGFIGLCALAWSLGYFAGSVIEYQRGLL